MTAQDAVHTQRGIAIGIVAELEAEGYHDAEPVGRGGFGVVYRCRQPSLDRVVAIKVLNSDQDRVELGQFEREQRAMGRVSGHPNVVPVLHSGVTFTGRPFIVMPYHGRCTLGAWIRSHGPLPLHEALTVGVRLAGALETAHRAGVLHRDVKPSNVLLSDYGEPLLSDFGIARIKGGRETVANVIVGSPPYVAPEMFQGASPSVAGDVYGLAATIFTLLSGSPPFSFRQGENPIAFARRVLAGPVPDLRCKGVPEPACAALELGLISEPDLRAESAAAFGEELRAAGAQVGLAIAEVPLESTAFDEDAGHGASPTGIADSQPIDASASSGVRIASVSMRRANYPPSPPTRFRPPTFNRPTVPRTHILQRLVSGRRPTLILIHAPAGYGKSTVAAQWGEILIAGDVKGAWLAIDGDDNNTDWFLAHLIEAIRHPMPDLADTLQQEFEGHLENSFRYVFNALITYLHSHKTTLALVLDDWHRVSHPDTIQALSYLLENACHHLHLIVTSRSRTGLPLSRLGVQGELVEIDASVLRFDVSESKALLVDQFGLQLTEADIAELEESTDGWAAALQLVSLSLRDNADPTTLIEHLSGRDKAIGEYLASNVLDNLEPEILEFLLSTCITKQTCAGLAAALTDDPHSRSVLEDIEKRDLFLRRTDPEGTWFQYTNLFAEYLQHRLERDSGHRVPELHRRAARWYVNQGLLSQAVDHLILAGDASEAADVVEQAANDLNEQSQMSTLIGLAAKLPARQADRRPALQANLAWANVVLRRSSATFNALGLAEASLDTMPTDETGDLRAELDLITAVIGAFADREDDDADAAVEACLNREQTLRPFILCRAADLASYRSLRKLDFDGALRWQRWGRQFHRGIAEGISVGYGYCFAALAANEQLDVAGAEAHLRHVIRTASLESGRPTYVATLAGSLLGGLLYECGHLDEAEILLDDAHDLGAEGGTVDFLLASYGTGARLKFARGDTRAAQQRLAEGLQIATELRLGRLEAGLLKERVRIAVSSGEPIGESVAQRIMSHDTKNQAADVAEFIEDARIGLLLVSGTNASRAQACDRAQARVARLDQRRRPRAHLHATIHLARCLAADGRSDEARRVLQPALRTCAALGLSRLLVDEGTQIIGLVHDIATSAGAAADDPASAANVADFVLNIADMSST